MSRNPYWRLTQNGPSSRNISTPSEGRSGSYPAMWCSSRGSDTAGCPSLVDRYICRGDASSHNSFRSMCECTKGVRMACLGVGLYLVSPPAEQLIRKRAVA